MTCVLEMCAERPCTESLKGKGWKKCQCPPCECGACVARSEDVRAALDAQLAESGVPKSEGFDDRWAS